MSTFFAVQVLSAVRRIIAISCCITPWIAYTDSHASHVGEANQENAMRIEFVAVKTHKQAVKACPWAAVVVKVDGGYRCFESVADADRAAGQR